MSTTYPVDNSTIKSQTMVPQKRTCKSCKIGYDFLDSHDNQYCGACIDTTDDYRESQETMQERSDEIREEESLDF